MATVSSVLKANFFNGAPLSIELRVNTSDFPDTTVILRFKNGGDESKINFLLIENVLSGKGPTCGASVSFTKNGHTIHLTLDGDELVFSAASLQMFHDQVQKLMGETLHMALQEILDQGK